MKKHFKQKEIFEVDNCLWMEVHDLVRNIVWDVIRYTVSDLICGGVRAIVWDYVMHPVQVVEALDADTELLLDEKTF